MPELYEWSACGIVPIKMAEAGCQARTTFHQSPLGHQLATPFQVFRILCWALQGIGYIGDAFVCDSTLSARQHA